MTTKLTLSLDQTAITRAKQIAKSRGKSLSKMVEEYFNSISEKPDTGNTAMKRIAERIAPYRDKLMLPENLDYNELAREWKYADFLKQKGQI